MLNWKHSPILAIAIAIAFGTFACTTPASTMDAGSTPRDSGPAAHMDAGPMAPVDAGPMDAGPELPIIDAGTLAIIAAYQDFPAGVSVQGSTVFWAASDSPGAILSAPIAGGAVTTVESARVNPTIVVTDATNVYWIDVGTFDTQGNYKDDGAVLQAALAGGAVTTLGSGQLYPAGLAVGSGHAYWVNEDPNNGNGAVVSNAIGGGTPSTLFSGRQYPLAIAVDSTNLYWADSGPNPTDSGTIQQVPLASLTSSLISTLATAQDNPAAMAVDAQNVYWGNSGDYDSSFSLMPMTGSIAAIPIGGSTVSTLATFQDNPYAMAVSATELYWVNNSITPAIGPQQGSIVEVGTTAGATPVTLISGAYAPSGIALGSGGSPIYFTDSGDIEQTGGALTSGVVFSFTP